MWRDFFINMVSCPFCGFLESKVVDIRRTKQGKTNRRRRECLTCVKRFTTYESLELAPITIIKSDGKREGFDKNKLLLGLLKSTEKRPITRQDLLNLVNKIESDILQKGLQEVNSNHIGDLVMKYLKELDRVSYIRFASVYKDFKDVQSFEQELKNLIGGKSYEN